MKNLISSIEKLTFVIILFMIYFFIELPIYILFKITGKRIWSDDEEEEMSF